jgi:methionine-R-sulfoxide reductase
MKPLLFACLGALSIGAVIGCETPSSTSHAAPATTAPSAAASISASPSTQASPSSVAKEIKTVKVKVFNKSGELVEIDSPRVVKTDEEWKAQLTPEQYKIARAKGTERPFCGNLLDNHKEGVYTCICCGLPLFSSDSKFNSGTGWPSFFQPVSKENVIEHVDSSYGMQRTEILCARCDCHLGHVFEDGPKPTGLRFCENSESLKFTEKGKLAELADAQAPMAKANQ